MKKQQVIFIHDGEMFDSYEKYLTYLQEDMAFDPHKDVERNKRWNRQLGNELGDDFDYVFPAMPNKYNAKYDEWKIWFEKVLDYADDSFILIGHSLGGTFLIKYLSENKISKKIEKLFLISSVISDPDHQRYQLDTFSVNKNLIKNISDRADQIILIHSKDDEEVPFCNFEELSEFLPNAKTITFEDRGHFMGTEFSELIEEIKK